MARFVIGVVIRLLLCSAVAYLLWRFLGLIGLVIAAPLFGVALTSPIITLVTEFRHATRRAVFANLSGRHFSYKGIALDIAEDDRHHRWISLRDLRKLIPTLPRDAVLQHQFPQGVAHDPVQKVQRIHADALLAYLAKSTDADSLRLRNWLDREVVRPAAKVRERLGIHDAVPTGSFRVSDE